MGGEITTITTTNTNHTTTDTTATTTTTTTTTNHTNTVNNIISGPHNSLWRIPCPPPEQKLSEFLLEKTLWVKKEKKKKQLIISSTTRGRRPRELKTKENDDNEKELKKNHV